MFPVFPKYIFPARMLNMYFVVFNNVNKQVDKI